MTWIWPLSETEPMFPDDPGRFAVRRTHDTHTGIDLYCEIGQEVVAVEDGEVVAVEGFTGPNADDPSPWWNDTQAVLIRGESGVVVYGEITALVELGDWVRQGEMIGVVGTPVLRTFRGRPTVMLHLELMVEGSTETLWWRHGEPQPAMLLNPEPLLCEAAGGLPTFFDLESYNETRFRGPLENGSGK